MPLLEVTNSHTWDAFMKAQPWSQFTQSWAWGEFKASLGYGVTRLVLAGDPSAALGAGSWEAAAQFVHEAKPLVGGYWYAPRGPIVSADLESRAAEIIARFMNEVSRHGLPRASLFWRIEPAVADPLSAFRAPGLVRSHAYMPASTLLIDLSKSDDELLSHMHEKTRYNIKVAERHGITVRAKPRGMMGASSSNDIETFVRLNEETAARDRFTSQPSRYVRATFDFLQARGMAHVRIAEKDGNALAASLEISFGDTRTYLYGASSSAARNLMAPYALHWDAIRSAKLEGFRYYDFHGVNPADESSPYFKMSWEGITRFKLGWGGERRDLAGTWEMPRRPLLYRVFRLISR